MARSPPLAALMVRLRAILALVIGGLIAWAAPLAGLLATGRPVAEFLAFPPRTEQVAHAGFSWAAFTLTAIPSMCAVCLIIAAVSRSERTGPRPVLGRFPWWAWLGVALVAAGWILAWTPGWVPEEWRRHTFTALWLGYALIMNGLALRRSGRCLLTHDTAPYLMLFPVSAGFWWLFEYLNQFTNNWYYGGIVAQGDLDYFLQGTLPFSTVLPAVLATRNWLATFRALDGMTLAAVHLPPSAAWIGLLAGIAALTAIPTRPDLFYGALWLGPLMILLGLQRILLGATSLAPLACGDWRPLLQPALAGLVCGFFWELWNYGSLAQWHYSIPYVQRFHVFEMPLLGYAGYLPFGVLCTLVAHLVASAVRKPLRQEAAGYEL